MKKVIWMIVILLIAGGAWFMFSGGANEINILVFSKTAGFRHDSIEPGQEAIKKIADENGYKILLTEDATNFKEEILKDMEVVIFLNTTMDVLDQIQQSQFERFIQAGGGFVGIHAATDTEYSWEWYGKLVGAYFNGHPNNPNVRDATMDILISDHPATDSLPKRWDKSDEWYNYKSINPNINVLINLDENSYEGGTNGDEHPMAWYHEYDGGRAFYTGMGHTKESFTDPLFLSHLVGGIKYAIGPGVPVDYSRAYSEPVPEENRFIKKTFVDDLYEPMEFDFLTDDKIIFVERRGAIKMLTLRNGETVVLDSLDVYYGQEDGILGVAVDPDFENNNWVYVMYSPSGDVAKQHVSRFEIVDNQFLKESEKVVLEIPTQREECCHAGGSLEFDSDGNLFISTGDDTNPHESGGYAPIDDREGRKPWDAARTSSNTNDLRGKILRITPTSEGGYEIPDGNLFSADGSEGKPEIYVMGCRNPFRISVDSKTGYLYWGDVGPDANVDSLNRGARGHDEINQAKGPGYYGWPFFVGDNKAYYDFDFETNTSGNQFDPKRPINNSANNTGATELPPAQPAMIYYPYAVSEEFPMLGSGSRNAMAGPVFYLDEYEDSGVRFPEFFDGKLIAYDWMRQWMFLVNFDENGDFEKLTPFLPNMEFDNIMDMAFGKDGALYIMEYGRGWFSQNPESKISRIEFIAGNRNPIAKIEMDQTIGAKPFNASFTGSNSIDFDGESLSYSWDFDGLGQSSEPNPTFIFDKAGIFEITLTVSDPAGNSSVAKETIKVGNEPPQIEWEFTSGNTSFYLPGEPVQVSYSVNVTDKEDGSGDQIDPSKIVVSINYLPEGLDITESAQGHQALVNASAGALGKSLMDGSDCNVCHKMDQASVGPMWIAVAEKYEDDEDAKGYLAKKIINGGSGVWGEIAMAAHPTITMEEASAIASYVLSVGNEEATLSLPPEGDFQGDDHISTGTLGTYIFTATYTDDGGEEIGPLSTTSTFMIKSAKIQTESYDYGKDAMKFSVKADDTPGIDEDMTIVIGGQNSYFRFDNIDLTGVQAITGRFAFAPGITKGGVMEIRIDDDEGELIGQLEIESSLTKMGLEEIDVPISSTKGRHDIYFKFANEDPDTQVITVLDWIQFKSGTVQ